MTAAQKIAKEKFKKAIAYRQKTGVSLKEAFAHIYGKKTVKKKTAKKVGKVTLKKANYHPRDERYIIMNDGVPHLEGKPFFKETAKDVASALRKVKAKRKVSAKQVGTVKRKTAKKKPSEQSILNKIHTVKHDVDKLDEAQHKHMMSGLTKIVGKIFNKYYVEFMHPNGYKCREYYNKYPTNRFVGVDRYIYVPKLTQKGTSLVALKHSKTDKQVKK